MRSKINALALAAFAVALLAITGCTKPENDNNIPGGPSVTTLNATNITATSAVIGGKVTNRGACDVVTSGVAISTSPEPTIDANTYINTNPNDTGTFTFTATGLLPATKYYVRAYAINCKGINYGNEITFITPIGGGGGGGGTDTGFFNLTVDGVNYLADDMLGPNAGRIYPEGDQRSAILSLDSSTGEFTVLAQSNYLYEPAQSTGYLFQIQYKPLQGTGTYTFTFDASGKKAVSFQSRKGTGTFNPLGNNFDILVNGVNYSRSLDGSGNCNATSITPAGNTLQITTWQLPGGFIEGVFNGTLYENTKTEFNCQNSTAHSYSGNFKLKRLQ